MGYLFNCMNGTGCAVMHGGSTAGTLLPDTYVYWPGNSGVGTSIACSAVPEHNNAVLQCPPNTFISAVNFASFGTPNGVCGAFTLSTCNALTTMQIATSLCLGFQACAMWAE